MRHMMYRIDIMKKIAAAAAAAVLLTSPAACFAEEAVPAAEPAPAVQPVDPAPAVQPADPAPAVQPADPAPAPAADAGGSGGGEAPAPSADSGGETTVPDPDRQTLLPFRRRPPALPRKLPAVQLPAESLRQKQRRKKRRLRLHGITITAGHRLLLPQWRPIKVLPAEKCAKCF